MIYKSVQKLIDYAVRCNLITTDDEFVVRNRFMQILGLDDWCEQEHTENTQAIDSILDEITDYACENGIINDTSASRDLFDTKLMGVVTPFPHEVICEFNKQYSVSPETATDWYYSLSKNLNYVRAGRIAKDLKWTYDSTYGKLDITINLSKPEKDPRDIAAAKSNHSVAYPKCQLCPENAGYYGRADHPARQNLRPVPITVNGEKWQLQYSPYGYYNEHCIVFNENHVPMKIDASVFEKLFDIIDIFPHYFVGSNADLPIVGGSILSHEHFQGGKYTFPMEKAAVETYFLMSDFHGVHSGILNWPMSVIRVQSKDRHKLASACTKILEKWRSYSDPEVGIYAETDGVPHNTITPIARMDGDMYECDLVLRNNLTTEEYPLGVFHPHSAYHHIKKENIGLIEVMGLAVLPSRLAEELKALKLAMLSGNLTDDPKIASHVEWAKTILAENPDFSSKNADRIIHDAVGDVFENVLLNSGVFKRDDEGKAAFLRFVGTLSDGGNI